MRVKWSGLWISSKQPRKQRKYRANAPLHKRRKMMGVHLSKELKEKHKKRTIPVRKGDKIKVLRGQFKGKIGKIETVMLSKYKVYVEGVEVKKVDGRASKYPIAPSNLIIIELNKSDKKRVEAIARK